MLSPRGCACSRLTRHGRDVRSRGISDEVEKAASDHCVGYDGCVDADELWFEETQGCPGSASKEMPAQSRGGSCRARDRFMSPNGGVQLENNVTGHEDVCVTAEAEGPDDAESDDNLKLEVEDQRGKSTSGRCTVGAGLGGNGFQPWFVSGGWDI